MAKIENSAGFSSLLSLTIWITGILVALAVGFGMINGTLTIWFVNQVITAIAGWIVVILTLLGLILAILDRFS